MIKRVFIPILIFLLINHTLLSSVRSATYKPVENSYVTVIGTSTIHDWELKSDDLNSEVTFLINEQGEPEGLEGLIFKVKKSSLNSSQSGLDRRAHDALKANRHPEINFELKGANSFQKSESGYIVTAGGELKIAGVSRQVRVNATCVNGNGARLVCTGEHKMKMSDFNVDPPVMMFGALRVADEITIKYNLVLEP